MPTGMTFINRGRPSGERYNLYFNFPGHANRREGILKQVRRRDSVGGLNIMGANTRIWLASEDARDPDFFGPVGSFPTRVYVLRDGTYRITYNVNALTSAAAGGSVRTRVGKSGGAGTLNGSMSGFNVSSGVANMHGAAYASFINDLVSGDYLEIVSSPEGALPGPVNTIASGCTMQVELVSLPGETTLGGKQVISRSSVLLKAILTKGVSGFSGSTFVRVLKNGLSIMGSSDLVISSANQFAEFPQSWFSVKSFDVGDVVSLDVISEEAPYPRDLSAILVFGAVNA